MKIKYSPQCGTVKTEVKKIDENTISINGEEYYFPVDIVEFEVELPFIEAKRIDGILHLTVLYKYTELERSVWETKDANGKYRGTDYEDI